MKLALDSLTTTTKVGLGLPTDFAPEVRVPHPAEGGVGVPGSAAVRGSQGSGGQINFNILLSRFS